MYSNQLLVMSFLHKIKNSLCTFAFLDNVLYILFKAFRHLGINWNNNSIVPTYHMIYFVTHANNIYCKQAAFKINKIIDCFKFKMKQDILKCIRIFLLKIGTKHCIAVATYWIVKFFVHPFQHLISSMTSWQFLILRMIGSQSIV